MTERQVSSPVPSDGRLSCHFCCLCYEKYRQHKRKIAQKKYVADEEVATTSITALSIKSFHFIHLPIKRQTRMKREGAIRKALSRDWFEVVTLDYTPNERKREQSLAETSERESTLHRSHTSDFSQNSPPHDLSFDRKNLHAPPSMRNALTSCRHETTSRKCHSS